MLTMPLTAPTPVNHELTRGFEMTQQVTIELIGGRVQAYPPAKPTTPTVALGEPPRTFANPIRLELAQLYDEISRLPLGHPGRVTRLERWKTLERKVLGGGAS